MLLYQKTSWWAMVNPQAIVQRLYLHRALLLKLSWRNVELQHKGSILGLSWALMSPLLLFGAYAFVFLAVFEGRFGIVKTETRVDYAIGLFLGLALIQLFQEAMTTSPLVIVQNSSYVKRVVFPLEILPAAILGAALFRCLVALVLVLIAAAIWGPGLTFEALWLFPIVLFLGLLSLGVAWGVAALGVFLRDIAPIMQFLAVLLMFMSGVFYSLNRIPPAFSFLRFNPLLIVMESSRGVVLWHQSPDMMNILYLGVISVGAFLLGFLVFNVLRPTFVDVL